MRVGQLTGYVFETLTPCPAHDRHPATETSAAAAAAPANAPAPTPRGPLRFSAHKPGDATFLHAIARLQGLP